MMQLTFFPTPAEIRPLPEPSQPPFEANDPCGETGEFPPSTSGPEAIGAILGRLLPKLEAGYAARGGQG
jgi:hypothetical protein